MTTPSQADAGQPESEPSVSVRLLERTEQAVLGAILLDPDQLPLLAQENLAPEHFAKPIHRAIYQAAIDLRDSTGALYSPESAEWPAAVLSRARRYVNGLDTTYLYRLVNACHQTSHSRAYAAIVREGATRRLIIQAAIRLGHAAHQGATSRVITTAEPLITHLLHHPSRPDHLIDIPLDASQGPRPTDDEVELLATLTHHPRQVPDVAGVLHPSDFNNPITAQLYQSVTALAHRGDPIDPLTLHWEMHRRSALTDDAATVLDAVTTHQGSSALFLAERLLRTSLLRMATRTATALHADASDETVPLSVITRNAQKPLLRLLYVMRRWNSGVPTDGEVTSPPAVAAHHRARSSYPSPRGRR